MLVVASMRHCCSTNGSQLWSGVVASRSECTLAVLYDGAFNLIVDIIVLDSGPTIMQALHHPAISADDLLVEDSRGCFP